MRHRGLKFAFTLVVGTSLAQTPKAYQDARLVGMESAPCRIQENDASGTHPLCPEYLLQTEHVLYRVRPKNKKRFELLPIGERARFRIEKDKFLMRMVDGDAREREYILVAITPRGESTADAATIRLNHLQ
jgi:hypothetical protein